MWKDPTTKDLISFFGLPGSNITQFYIPYSMKIAIDPNMTISEFPINKKCVKSLTKIFWAIRKEFTKEEISYYGLDVFGDCFVFRKIDIKRWGINQWSTHAWGAALDIDPERNKENSKKHHLPDKAVDIFYAYGWINLGREIGIDWQHFQYNDF